MPAIAKTADRAPKDIGHMPQLDALRAIAVFGVLTHHFTNIGFDIGARLGVKLFFVLSGFLITKLLLRGRHVADISHSRVLLNFYARRSLRIFPLYYFVIGVALI